MARLWQQYTKGFPIQYYSDENEIWAGYVARIGDKRDVFRVWVGKPEGERDHLGDPVVDGWK